MLDKKRSVEIKIKGYVGIWNVVGKQKINEDNLLLLERETYGGDTEHLIVDENLNKCKGLMNLYLY